MSNIIAIKGRIVDFLRNRNEEGYAEFIFRSDYDKEFPRFNAFCAGKIPDVVPGVPITVEFKADSIETIKKVRNGRSNYFSNELNQLAYTCINYNDEDYAKTLLVKVKGISEKSAEKILDAVDGDIGRLSGLWENTEFWKGLRGSKRYLNELKETIGTMLKKDILVKKYSKYGIGYPQIDTLSAMYGLEAEEKLCQNPYYVLFKLDLDFQVADYLAKDIGFEHLDPLRIRAIIYNVLNNNEKNGNTAIIEKQFFRNCTKLQQYSAWKDYVVSPSCISDTLAEMKDVYCEKGMIGYIRTLDMEVDISYQLGRLMETNTRLNIPEESFYKIKNQYNPEQMEFLRVFDESSVSILLGRGGTGKTHTVCGAINLYKEKYPDAEIRLCAPTARAAGVLKEHSGHESSTIHILLELKPYGDDISCRDESNPLDVSMIVVDEMSMVDTELMYRLLKAVKSGTKLILCGDPDQLESVGCGAVLRDLINSSIVPKVQLKRIMRQNEGSSIIENCGKVLDGVCDFVTDNSFVIRKCKTENEARLYLKSCYDADLLHSQIISTTKKGTVGTQLLNKEFEKPEAPGVWLHGSHFKVGDKVIFTKNNYEKEYCNGDIGFIEKTNPLIVKMQDDNKSIDVDKDCSLDMEHAEVITIHKSQGSEYDNVYIMLPETPLPLLTRNMVNTAISRARKKVILIVVQNALKIAASNRYKTFRLTRLEEKLKNMEEAVCQEKREAL